MDILIAILALMGLVLVPWGTVAGISGLLDDTKDNDKKHKSVSSEDFSDWYKRLAEKNRKRNEERLRELEEWKK